MDILDNINLLLIFQLIMMTPTSITLEKMDFPASGSYACEIAMEIPLYSKGSKLHEISVIGKTKLITHSDFLYNI